MAKQAAARVRSAKAAEAESTPARAIADALLKSVDADANVGKSKRRWDEHRARVENANAHLLDVIRQHDPLLRHLDDLKRAQGTPRYDEIHAKVRRLVEERALVALKVSIQWTDGRRASTRPAEVTNEIKRARRGAPDDLIKTFADTYNKVVADLAQSEAKLESMDVDAGVAKALRPKPEFRNVSLRKLKPAAHAKGWIKHLATAKTEARRAGAKQRSGKG
jgi:hypothetical protein